MPTPPYPTPPSLDAFTEFRIPDGRVWTRSSEWETHDGGCVAIASHPDGWVAVADTKNPQTEPLIFNAKEWAGFKAAMLADRF